MSRPTFENGRLSFAYHELEEIPAKFVDKFAAKTLELDLSHNRLKELRSIEGFTLIHTLILDNNDLASRTKFPIFSSLTTLWVNKNNITNLAEFVDTVAASFPGLKHLSLMNNPAAPSYFNGGTVQQYQDYRLFVISHFPQLVMLDDTAVTKQEREEADKIYGTLAASTKLMRQSSKAVLAKDRDADTFSLLDTIALLKLPAKEIARRRVGLFM